MLGSLAIFYRIWNPLWGSIFSYILILSKNENKFKRGIKIKHP